MAPTQEPKKNNHDIEKMMKEMTSELAKINKELDKTRDGGKKRGVKELESGGITIILEALARTMDLAKSMLAKGPEENCPRVRVLEEKTRVLEDSSDAHHQRSLKGKFMISSKKENNIISSETKLKEEGVSTPKYVGELLFRKLGVRVAEAEIVSCHHTTTGMIIFRLGDFKPGSAFQQVVTAIKNGAGKDVSDLFVNFALTPRRASLLYEVRQLKKAKKISKFHTDSDGSITMVKTDGTKMKITASHMEKRGSKEESSKEGSSKERGSKVGGGTQAQTKRSTVTKTLTKEELLDRFSI